MNLHIYVAQYYQISLHILSKMHQDENMFGFDVIMLKKYLSNDLLNCKIKIVFKLYLCLKLAHKKVHFREFMPSNCPKHKDIQLLVIADKENLKIFIFEELEPFVWHYC